jgi:hypothetical protein
MISKTLGAGSVKCVVEVEENGQSTEYSIEREIDELPRVSRNGVRDPLAEELLHEIEIYSQGALQQIASADQPSLRLDLIDRPNRIVVQGLKKEISSKVQQLKAIGSQARTFRAEIDKRKVDVRDITQIRADLGNTVNSRPTLPPTLQEQHAAFIQRQQTIEVLRDLEEVRKAVTVHLGETQRFRDQIRNLLERIPHAPQDQSIRDLAAQLETKLTQIDVIDRDVKQLPVVTVLAKVSAEFEVLNEGYYSARQQQQELNESLKREDSFRRRLAELEKGERELQDFESRRSGILGERQKFRADLGAARDKVFELRVAEVDRINQEFGDVVVLTVRRAAHSKPYVDRLSQLLSGSRIRAQEDIALEMAKALSPSDLLDVIETGDAPRVANLLGRDLGQMSRVVTYLRDHPELYDLEGDLSDDSLEITMFDKGQPKPVEDLSEGQRATALLPLILRSSDCPLIIDQPEDDLDNSFIFQVLVKNVLKLKQQRQLIFVTHNANIPVLGDSESVIVMHMDNPTKASSPKIGSLDERKKEILELLEGGKEAFEHREKRYHSLLQ